MTGRLRRRSFLALVAGGVLIASPAAGGAGTAERKWCGRRRRGTGVTDADSGPGADPAGHGRGPAGGAPPRSKAMQASGVTDQDAGPNADPPRGGRGRAPARRAPITDGDTGPISDAPCGGGRRPR